MDFLDFKGTKFTLLKNKNGDPWWVAKELCDYLELGNVGQAVAPLPDDWKMKIVIKAFKSPGRGGDNGRRIIVNEPGMWQLVSRSKKGEAIELQRWFYSEVLPSIRKTGSYSIQRKIEAPKAPPQQIPPAPKTYKEAVQHLLVQIEENPVTYGVTIDETNLVYRISMALNAYRRQKDRMADIMDQIKRIASGE